jgi:hypothetical protein
MFGGRFSLAKFSLRDKVELDTRINAFFVENTHSMISLGQATPIEVSFRERFDMNIIGTRGFSFFNFFEENIDGEINGARNYGILVDYMENISSEAQISSNISFINNFTEKINADASAVKNIKFENNFKEEITSDVAAGKDIPFEINMRESVMSVIYAGLVDEDTFLIDINIPPGAEIRIDSEYFTVTLDGENIIHQHFGDWVNISRDTLEIIISSDGYLDGQVIYMERFL